MPKQTKTAIGGKRTPRSPGKGPGKSAGRHKVKVSRNDTFGLDLKDDIMIEAWSEPTEHTPKLEPSYIFPPVETRVVLMGFANRDRVLSVGHTGTGKAVTCSTRIPTPYGMRAMGSLAVGDLVFGSNGEPTKVLGVYPQGERDVYKVTFRDGSKATVDGEHLWTVNNHNWERAGTAPKTMTTLELLEHGLRYAPDKSNPNGKAKFWVPTAKAVQFGDRGTPLPLDPYTLGVLLGDGSFTRGAVFTNSEMDIVDRLVIPKGDELVRCVTKDRAPTWSIKGGATTRALRGLELMGCLSSFKFIPDIYKTASIEDRLQLLRGLCDTDGHVDYSGKSIEYVTTSHALCKDFCFLAQSLGGLVNVVEKYPTYSYRGEDREGLKAYRCTLHMPDHLIPVSSKKHLARYIGKDGRRYLRTIESIEPAGKAQCVCIKVDAEDELFCINDFIVTHNTSLFEQVAARLNYNVIKISFDSCITRNDLVGEWVVKDGSMEFQYGIMPLAMRMPGTVIILDEWDTQNEDVSFVIQRLLQKEDGHMLLLENKGELVPLHPDNIVVATANTVGQGDDTGLYAQGTRVQNYAQLNRFGLTIRMDYLKPELEKAMLMKRFDDLKQDEADAFIVTTNKVRDGFANNELSVPLSTRDLINWVEKYTFMGDPMKAATFCFLNRMSIEDAEVCKGIIQRSFEEA